MPVEDELSLKKILEETKTIAVVGASDKPWRDSNSIAGFLLQKNYRVIPVNPGHTLVLGLECFPDLKSVPVGIDLVDIFRKSEAVEGIVDDAIALKVKVIWMQYGVVNENAAAKAEKAGLQVVMDRCIAVDYRRLIT